LARFAELNTQVLGISGDSVYSHRAFADFLGGLTFPLLADFHPKGEVQKKYGVWREERGYPWRTVYIVDKEGLIRWAKWIEKGAPDIEDVLAAVKEIA